MRYASIPNTPLSPSVLCLGTADIGTKCTEKEGHEILDAFIEAGGTFIDTARVYSDWVPGERGRCERILGDWLAARDVRSRIILATKGGHPDLATMDVSRLTPETVRSDMDASLRALRVDTVDIYYLHRDNPDVPVSELVDVLDEQVGNGKTRYHACSNWTPARIRAAREYALSRKSTGFVANQMLWSIGSPGMRPPGDTTMQAFSPAMRELHLETGMAAVPYSSQATGFFTKLEQGLIDPTGGQRAHDYDTPANRALFDTIRGIADDNGMTVSQVVLAYLLSQPFPTFPIIGCRNLHQLRDSLTAADVTLSVDQVTRLTPAGPS